MRQPVVVSNPRLQGVVVRSQATPSRIYQCPGCFGYAVHRQPLNDGWIECDCGERMTLIDLRARSTDGAHGQHWHEDER